MGCATDRITNKKTYDMTQREEKAKMSQIKKETPLVK